MTLIMIMMMIMIMIMIYEVALLIREPAPQIMIMIYEVALLIKIMIKIILYIYLVKNMAKHRWNRFTDG